MSADRPPRRRLKRLGRVLLVLAGLTAIGALAALKPLDETPYFDGPFYEDALSRVAAVAHPAIAEGPVSAGFGEATLTPTLDGTADDPAAGRFVGLRLAGYSKHIGKGIDGVADPVSVHAVAFAVGGRRVVVLGMDMLMVPPEVALRLRRDVLPSLGLSGDDIYLAGTHTHTAPGGWYRGLAGYLIGGTYRPGLVDWMTAQAAQAIRAALADLKPATLASATVDLPEMTWNRNRQEPAPVDGGLFALAVRQTGGRTAVIGSYGAHPTTRGAGDLRISGDYPGVWERQMKAAGYDVALFMAGAVGGQSANREDATRGKPEAIGTRLAEETVKALVRATPLERVPLATATVGLPLPPPQYRISAEIVVRPWLLTRVIDLPQEARIDALRIGDALLVGAPCDYSGELAAPFRRALAGAGLDAVVTSFNGGYVGYVQPSSQAYLDSYERDMEFYGTGLGDYMDEMIGLMTKGLAAPPGVAHAAPVAAAE